MKDREKALREDILYDSKKVNAKITYKGDTFYAKIKLKGEASDHWLSKLRMSLRVELKNNKTIFGFNKFSIQKPRSRQHPYDQIFQSLMKDLNILSPVHKFAHFYLNGEDWGVMDITEHMSKELLEKQKRKDSLIVSFSDSMLTRYKKKSVTPYEGYRLSSPFLYVHLYNDKKIKNLHNRMVYSYILKMHLLRDLRL